MSIVKNNPTRTIGPAEHADHDKDEEDGDAKARGGLTSKDTYEEQKSEAKHKLQKVLIHRVKL